MMFQLLILQFVLHLTDANLYKSYYGLCRGDCTKRFYEISSPFKGCDFRGYWPGGNVTKIGEIETPTAALAQKDAMGMIFDVLGGIGAHANIGMHTINEVNGQIGADRLKALFPKWTKLAPKLAPALGIFGALMAAYLPSTGPEDILEATNKAIEKLGDEIDNKMEKMTGYVDTKITTLERHLIQRDVRVMMRLLTACLDEPTEDFREECLREAYATLSAWRPKFTIFDQDYIIPKKPIEIPQMKDLEAYLPSVHIYANLVLMSAKVLVSTYNNTIITEEDGKSTTWTPPDVTTLRGTQYIRYLNQMDKQLKFLKTYVKNAVHAILVAHKGNCVKTLKCELKDTKSNFYGRTLAKVHECQCTIDEGTKQFCKAELKIYAKKESDSWTVEKQKRMKSIPDKDQIIIKGGLKGRKLNSVKDKDKILIKKCKDEKCILDRISKAEFKEETKTFEQASQAVIRHFWKVNLLDTIPSWNKGDPENELKKMKGQLLTK